MLKTYFSVKPSLKHMVYLYCLVPSCMLPCQAFHPKAVNIFPTTLSAVIPLLQDRLPIKLPWLICLNAKIYTKNLLDRL